MAPNVFVLFTIAVNVCVVWCRVFFLQEYASVCVFCEGRTARADSLDDIGARLNEFKVNRFHFSGSGEVAFLKGSRV